MTPSSNNTGRSWGTAAIGGGIVGLLLLVVGSGVLIALLVGLVIFAIGLMLLPRRKAPDAVVTREVRSPAVPARPLTPPEPEPVAAEMPNEPEPVTAKAPRATPSETEPPQVTASTLVKASKALPGQIELAARKGTWRFEHNTAST